MQERGRREKQESLLARDEGERREGAKADRREDTDGQRGAGTAERTAAATLEGRGLRAESRLAGAASLPRRPRAQCRRAFARGGLAPHPPAGSQAPGTAAQRPCGRRSRPRPESSSQELTVVPERFPSLGAPSQNPLLVLCLLSHPRRASRRARAHGDLSDEGGEAGRGRGAPAPRSHSRAGAGHWRRAAPLRSEPLASRPRALRPRPRSPGPSFTLTPSSPVAPALILRLTSMHPSEPDPGY